MFCHKCGAPIAEKAVFCEKCGTRVVYTDAGPQISPPNGSNGSASFTSPPNDVLRCPNCHSTDLIPTTETTTNVSGGG